MKRRRPKRLIINTGRKSGKSQIRSFPPYEEEYPSDMLYHPSPALKRLEKMIEEDDYNPSRRNQRTSKEILDDAEFDSENDT